VSVEFGAVSRARHCGRSLVVFGALALRRIRMSRMPIVGVIRKNQKGPSLFAS
jgi:hypothetical protein